MTAGRRLITLSLVSLLVGGATGLVCALLRLALQQADRIRDGFVGWAHGMGGGGLLLVVAAAAGATGLAAWLVRRFSPDAAGSGIPQVELALRSEQPARPLHRAVVKFAGSLLSMGAGLALGREGPSVQMGAAIADVTGEIFRRDWAHKKVLFAACAGAGLATAFNAPMAGGVFVLEELLRKFETETAIAALGASAGAITVARLLIGVSPDFTVAPQPYPGLATLPVHIALGIVAGLLGAGYTRAILGALAVADRLQDWPRELRAAIIGAAVGLLLWFAPDLAGGGDALTQKTLAGGMALTTVAVVFALRFVLGPLSYAAAVPGGLFAPMLVLGAQTGLIFGLLCERWLPGLAAGPAGYAIVGMAAFFVAVVRAPLTGIVLITEMTGSASLLLPMLAACFAAMATPALLRVPPIYDLLRERLAAGR